MKKKALNYLLGLKETKKFNWNDWVIINRALSIENEEAKKEVFDDLEKTDIWKYAGNNYTKIKQHHLSTLDTPKELNSQTIQSADKCRFADCNIKVYKRGYCVGHQYIAD